ncbi:MAG: hypothetical protein PVH41_01995 [Anaerolineae bacterium]
MNLSTDMMADFDLVYRLSLPFVKDLKSGFAHIEDQCPTSAL